MKKTLLLMAVMGGMVLSLQAQAQHYLFADVGSIGSEPGSAEYEKLVSAYWGPRIVTGITFDAKLTHEGSYTNFGYGYKKNDQTSFEIAQANLGTVKDNTAYIVNGDATTGEADLTHEWDITATDFSYIGHKSINDDKAAITFRAGLSSIDIKETTGNPFFEGTVDADNSGTVLLYGIGAKFGKIRAEYRFYNLGWGYTYGGTDYIIYDSINVLSVGYQFEF